MADQGIIEIRMTGENVVPGNVRSRDIADLIASVEQMIASIVIKNNPELGFKEEEIVVGLVAVREGSLALDFSTPPVYQPVVVPAYNSASESIQTRNFDRLPLKSIDSLRTIRNIAVKYQASTEFRYNNGRSVLLATVNRDTPIEVPDRAVEGVTTLYGIVVRVGGEKIPTVQLRLLNGDTLNCEIRGDNKRALARQLAQRLYTEVGIEGRARWDTREWVLESFAIERITDYARVSVGAALQNLYERMGTRLEAIDDIDSFLADVRGDDEEND